VLPEIALAACVAVVVALVAAADHRPQAASIQLPERGEERARSS
jgi:hypothetical protein